jgi:hypothetical protein
MIGNSYGHHIYFSTRTKGVIKEHSIAKGPFKVSYISGVAKHFLQKSVTVFQREIADLKRKGTKIIKFYYYS